MNKPTMKIALLNLLESGWVTPLDALKKVGCLSLSQRCGELRSEGKLIVDKWVHLDNGKRVKAYRLAKSVTYQFLGEGERPAIKFV